MKGIFEVILNLTQHPATPEQAAVGVAEPADKRQVQALLTFDTLPHSREIREAATQLAEIAVAHGAQRAMIGGAPFLMGPLEAALKAVGIVPMYAFSKRVVVEMAQADGSVRKVAEFRHEGFVVVY